MYNFLDRELGRGVIQVVQRGRGGRLFRGCARRTGRGRPRDGNSHEARKFARDIPFKPERVKEFMLRAEELGVPAASPMFGQAVAIVCCVSPEKVAAKFEFFKRTLGCSESEVSIAVSRMPQILGLSDATLLRKIEFLVNEAAMEPQYIVQRPILLTFSLEKRSYDGFAPSTKV